MSKDDDARSGSDWGLNFEKLNCPACGEAMPPIRIPKGWVELMWGGWTCPSCGCRMDKWGKARDADKT